MTDPCKPLALIVEDDPRLSIIFVQAVQKAGFETQAFRNGGTALAALQTLTPQVVVLDLHLPDVSGDRILYQIRQDERLKQTRVILATADAAMADALQDQSDLVLIKPISFSQLRDLAVRLKSQCDGADDTPPA